MQRMSKHPTTGKWCLHLKNVRNMQLANSLKISKKGCLHLKNVRSMQHQSFGEKVKIEGRLVYLIER